MRASNRRRDNGSCARRRRPRHRRRSGTRWWRMSLTNSSRTVRALGHAITCHGDLLARSAAASVFVEERPAVSAKCPGRRCGAPNDSAHPQAGRNPARRRADQRLRRPRPGGRVEGGVADAAGGGAIGHAIQAQVDTAVSHAQHHLRPGQRSWPTSSTRARSPATMRQPAENRFDNSAVLPSAPPDSQAATH